MSASIYTEVLEDLGFDRWTEEDFGADAEWSREQVKGPCFWIVQIGSSFLTFAFDELGEFWGADGEIDLGDLGFRDLDPEEEEHEESRSILH